MFLIVGFVRSPAAALPGGVIRTPPTVQARKNSTRGATRLVAAAALGRRQLHKRAALEEHTHVAVTSSCGEAEGPIRTCRAISNPTPRGARSPCANPMAVTRRLHGGYTAVTQRLLGGYSAEF